MAGKNRKQATDIENLLQENGRDFSFYQILRLLFSITQKKHSGTNLPVNAHWVKLIPNLSLAFPGTDIQSVEKNPDSDQFTVLINFLGLYGTCAPLPTFYSEDIIDDASRGDNTFKTFIDVINHRLYELLFAGWSKYRTMQRVMEDQNPVDEDRLFSLIGMAFPQLRQYCGNPYELLRYTGLFSMGARSASGLETILTDAFEGIPVHIEQGVQRWGNIPEDQQTSLGNNGSMGVDLLLGSQCQTCIGTFKIEIGPVPGDVYRRFFPGEQYHKKLASLTQLYVCEPFAYTLEIILDRADTPSPACLGQEKWSRLGLDTWVYSDDGPKEYRVVFYEYIAFNEAVNQ